jgi:hypothetical protein
MLDFLALHQIAAARGDGLRPELHQLFQRRSMTETDAKVEDLASWREAPVPAGGPPPPATPRHMAARIILRFPDPRPMHSIPVSKRLEA